MAKQAPGLLLETVAPSHQWDSGGKHVQQVLNGNMRVVYYYIYIYIIIKGSWEAIFRVTDDFYL